MRFPVFIAVTTALSAILANSKPVNPSWAAGRRRYTQQDSPDYSSDSSGGLGIGDIFSASSDASAYEAPQYDFSAGQEGQASWSDASQEAPQEPYPEPAQEAPQEFSQEAPQEPSQEFFPGTSQDSSQVAPQEPLQEVSQQSSQENPLENPQEVPQQAPQEVPQETSPQDPQTDAGNSPDANGFNAVDEKGPNSVTDTLGESLGQSPESPSGGSTVDEDPSGAAQAGPQDGQTDNPSSELDPNYSTQTGEAETSSPTEASEPGSTPTDPAELGGEKTNPDDSPIEDPLSAGRSPDDISAEDGNNTTSTISPTDTLETDLPDKTSDLDNDEIPETDSISSETPAVQSSLLYQNPLPSTTKYRPSGRRPSRPTSRPTSRPKSPNPWLGSSGRGNGGGSRPGSSSGLGPLFGGGSKNPLGQLPSGGSKPPQSGASGQRFGANDPRGGYQQQGNDGPQQTEPEKYERMKWYASYAAASYCDSVINKTEKLPEMSNAPPIPIICQKGMCPLLADQRAVAAHRAPNRGPLGVTFNDYDETWLIAEDTKYNTIVLAFEGTDFQRFGDVTKFSSTFSQVRFPANGCNNCWVSRSFWGSWNAQKSSILAELLELNPQHIVVVGHSAGAAVATLAAADLRTSSNLNNVRIDLYSYASPRIGNPEFATYVTNQAEKSQRGENFRITHYHDPTPQSVKIDAFNDKWLHPAPEYFITVRGDTSGSGDVQYFPAVFDSRTKFVTESSQGNSGPNGTPTEQEWTRKYQERDASGGITDGPIIAYYHRHHFIWISGPYC